MMNQIRMTEIRNEGRKISGLTAMILSLLVCRLASAAMWNLTDARFFSRSVEVSSIDAAGVHVAENSSATVVPWNDVLELSQNGAGASASGGRFSLVFRSGDALDGEPVTISGDTLQWRSAHLGEIGFPMDSLAAIVQSGSNATDLDQVRTDDVVHLANGDSAHGIVMQIGPAGVTIQTGDTTPTLAWESVSAVLFSTAQAGSPTSPGRAFRVQFAGGQSVTAAAVSLAEDKVTIVLDGKHTRQIDADAVEAIEQINGPIAWLTSRKPAENIYRPMFGEHFPTRFDRTVADGKPIREKYPSFHHGIGCHSYSKLVYDLDGKWQGFRTQFAIDSDSPLADVTVRIYLDDKVAFERKNVKAGRIYPVVMLRLGGAKRLSLEVDYGQNYTTEDRFVWLDPALVRTLSLPTTQPK
jgi:NPCBM/NEW2 domain